LEELKKNDKFHPGQAILWSKFQPIHEYKSGNEHQSETSVMPGPIVFCHQGCKFEY